MIVPLEDLGTRYGILQPPFCCTIVLRYVQIFYTQTILANCFILPHLLTYETDPEFARQWIFKVTHHQIQVSQGYNTFHFILSNY